MHLVSRNMLSNVCAVAPATADAVSLTGYGFALFGMKSSWHLSCIDAAPSRCKVNRCNSFAWSCAYCMTGSLHQVSGTVSCGMS
jgi:hypothetical protein